MSDGTRTRDRRDHNAADRVLLGRHSAHKAFFDEVASDWDAMRLTYYDERVIEHLAARTQLTGEQTVVDIGTGTGLVAAGVAAHAHRVLGFDNAVSMLEIARADVDRLGVDNVELSEGDVADLPLPDHAVDAAVANTSDQIEGFFGEARLQHYGYAPRGTQ